MMNYHRRLSPHKHTNHFFYVTERMRSFFRKFCLNPIWSNMIWQATSRSIDRWQSCHGDSFKKFKLTFVLPALQKLKIACQSNFKSFPENEALFNDKYASKFEPNYDYSLTFNNTWNSPPPPAAQFQPKLSTVNSEDMNELLKKTNYDLENTLIRQSQFSYSVFERLDKETTI